MKKINGRVSRSSPYSGRGGFRKARAGEESAKRTLVQSAARELEKIEVDDSEATSKWCLDESAVRMRTVTTADHSGNFAAANPASEQSSASSTALLRVKPVQRSMGPYRLVCELASGGMGTVYLAARRGAQGFEKFIAVKSIHPHLAHDPEFASMFVDEARFAGAINHANVCNVFDFGHVGDDYFIAMEFLQGRSLSRVLWQAAQSGRGFSSSRYPRIIARIISAVAEGLNAVHSLTDEHGKPLEVVHRDVTPQNIFVLFDGTVRLTDLGIARARERLHQTHGYAIKGKLAYMAPEQLERRPLDTRVDLWALGVVMWELLSLHRLFRGSNEGETVLAVTSRSIALPSTLNSNVPKALDDIVMKALQRDPDRRYQTARELSRDLEAFLASSGDTVPSVDVAEWMTELFPSAQAEYEQLLAFARDAMLEPPRQGAEPARATSVLMPERAIQSGDTSRIIGRTQSKVLELRRVQLTLVLSYAFLFLLSALVAYELAEAVLDLVWQGF